MAERLAFRPDPVQRDELWRRIGRNLLQFQKIEGAWKQLLLIALVETQLDGSAVSGARAVATLRMNMGEALKAVLKEVVSSTPSGVQSKGSFIRSRFSIVPEEPAAVEALRVRWQRIVDERNLLVHHQLDRLTSLTDGEAARVLEELEAQYEAAVAVLAEVLAIIQQVADAQRELAEHFGSPEGHAQLLVGFAVMHAIETLWRVAETHARSDGWTLLQTAQQALHGLSSEYRMVLEQHHGSRWLDSVLASTEIFEQSDEPWPNHPGQDCPKFCV